jgi:hypothetical protein
VGSLRRKTKEQAISRDEPVFTVLFFNYQLPTAFSFAAFRVSIATLFLAGWRALLTTFEG